MAEAHDLLGLGPAQDVDHMRSAEALAGVLDRRQDLLRVLGPVDMLGRVKAAVAVAASAGPLAEIVEQCHPAAGRRLAIAQKRVEPLVLAALALRPRVFLLDELPTRPDVGETVEHVRLGGRTVPPGPADLLRGAGPVGRKRCGRLERDLVVQVRGSATVGGVRHRLGVGRLRSAIAVRLVG